MGAIRHLCPRSVVLFGGRLSFDGMTDETISEYLSTLDVAHGGEVSLVAHPQRRKGATPLLRSIRCVDQHGHTKSRFLTGEPITIEFLCDPIVPMPDPAFGIGFDDSLGTRVFSVATYLSNARLPALRSCSTIVCRINNVALRRGDIYSASAQAHAQIVCSIKSSTL